MALGASPRPHPAGAIVSRSPGRVGVAGHPPGPPEKSPQKKKKSARTHNRVAWAIPEPDRSRAPAAGTNPQAPARSRRGCSLSVIWPVAGQAACADGGCPAPDGPDGSGSFQTRARLQPLALGAYGQNGWLSGHRRRLSTAPLLSLNAQRRPVPAAPRARSGAPAAGAGGVADALWHGDQRRGAAEAGVSRTAPVACNLQAT